MTRDEILAALMAQQRKNEETKNKFLPSMDSDIAELTETYKDMIVPYQGLLGSILEDLNRNVGRLLDFAAVLPAGLQDFTLRLTTGLLKALQEDIDRQKAKLEK